MALKAPIGGENRVPQANIEPDVYPARIVQIIDLGLQAQKPYKGEDKKPVNELMVTYELVSEFMKDEDGKELEDKPRWISETFPFHPLFADKAKSTKRYLALDPAKDYDGDWAKLLGCPCNVTIVNNKSGDKVYDNVASVAAMSTKKAATCPELVNPAKMFDLDAPDMEVFNKLPKWIQDKLKANLNFNGSPLQKLLGGAKAPEKKEEKPEAEEENNNSPY